MRLIYNDLGTALSVKSCYSRYITTVSLFAMLLLLPAVLLLQAEEKSVSYSAISSNFLVAD